MTGHTAHTGHTRALDTEREIQVTHGDLDHGVRVHIISKEIDTSITFLPQFNFIQHSPVAYIIFSEILDHVISYE